MKVCKECKEEKELDQFPISSTSKAGKPSYRSLCKRCYNMAQREYREGDPETQERIRRSWRESSKRYMTVEKRRNKTLAKYDMTTEDYNRMFDEQNGGCAICQKNISLVVDHCHNTNRVRGLLCNHCNTALGMFEDDVDRLQQAMLYLL